MMKEIQREKIARKNESKEGGSSLWYFARAPPPIGVFFPMQFLHRGYS
jgi:hypothetical protein